MLFRLNRIVRFGVHSLSLPLHRHTIGTSIHSAVYSDFTWLDLNVGHAEINQAPSHCMHATQSHLNIEPPCDS